MRKLKKGSPGESGQALILFTIMTVAFLGFCLLVLDVGRAYAERRYMQNAADAGALKVASLAGAILTCDDPSTPGCVVVSTTPVWKGQMSALTYAEAQKNAQAQANANGSLLGSYTAPINVTVQYWTWNTSTNKCGNTGDPQTISPITPPDVYSTNNMPGTTCQIRVTAQSSWTTWFPLPTDSARQPAGAAAAATSIIRGGPTIPGPTWPMVRRWSKVQDPNQDPPDNPFVFWDSGVNTNPEDAGGAQWKAVINFGLYSDLAPYSLPASISPGRKYQTIEPAQPPIDTSIWRTYPDMSCLPGFACGRDWDSRANDKNLTSSFVQNIWPRDAQNWGYYGWNGTLSWGTAAQNPYNPGIEWWNKQCGEVSGSTGDCQVPSAWDSTYHLLGSPTPTVAGDWVETYTSQPNANENIGGGDIGNNLAPELASYIERNGYPCPFSDYLVPHKSYTLGKCVVMNMYLWEGGQVYDRTTNQWNGWDGSNSTPPSRVHIVDMKPFAFYLNYVTAGPSSQIEGFWISKTQNYLPKGGGGIPNDRTNGYILVGE